VDGWDLYFPRERIVGLSIGEDMDAATETELLEAIDAAECRFPTFKAKRSAIEFKVDEKALTLR
jgi:hypothetical protein